MSRIHSSRKGKAGSRKPQVTKSPEWVSLQPSDIEAMVVKLGKEGMSSAQIGLRLRDQYGVPNVRLATGKDITTILEANGMKYEVPEDLDNLVKRSIALQAHMKTNPKDLENKRGYTLIESKVRRLTKYYKRKGVIPEDWTPAATLETIVE